MSNGNATQDDDAVVSYSVKELLSDIKGSIDRMYGKLDSKADRSEVTELANQLSVERHRINKLETGHQADRRVNETFTEWKRYVVPTLLAVALLVVALIQLMKE